MFMPSHYVISSLREMPLTRCLWDTLWWPSMLFHLLHCGLWWAWQDMQDHPSCLKPWWSSSPKESLVWMTVVNSANSLSLLWGPLILFKLFFFEIKKIPFTPKAPLKCVKKSRRSRPCLSPEFFPPLCLQPPLWVVNAQGLLLVP